MKIYFLPTRLLILLILFIVINFAANAQLRISIGGTVGGGFLKGNSPSVGTVTTSFFLETNTVLFSEVFPRLGIIYARDFNAIIPNVDKPYFPYVQGITFKGITTQYFDGRYFLEEGVGLLALNDRTFSDTDDWNFGIVLSINGGFDLRGFNLDGFKLGAGAEYGITFTNALPQYSSIHFFVTYTF
ncbi:MAG: hypothetical protein WBQ32_13190 [Ignavibacteriaceae bacterium]